MMKRKYSVRLPRDKFSVEKGLSIRELEESNSEIFVCSGQS